LPIERGRPGPALLAHVLVGKYADHCPLYRQSGIYARAGVELDRSTLADWVGQSAALLAPLAEAITRHVKAGITLHADDTPVPVLDPGRQKTKTGRLWTLVRDERPWGSAAPPAVSYLYSPDRKSEHARRLLEGCSGFLHADGYAGFERLYAADPFTGQARLGEVACFAHARRKFFEVYANTASPLAMEALERIGQLFAIEAEIKGKHPPQRHAARQQRSRPLLDDLRCFLERALSQISKKSSLAGAIRYSLTRWNALGRYTEDGRLEISNNAAERAIKPLASAESLCPSSSSVWKHWKLVGRGLVTRAALAGERRCDALSSEVFSPNLPWCARHHLFGGEFSVPDEPADSMTGDTELRRGLAHGEPGAVLLCRTIGVHAVHLADRPDAVSGPRLALAGAHAHPVQGSGDVGVGEARRHARHDGEGLLGRPAPMLARLRLAHAQARVLAATPMDRQHHLARRFIHVGDDVGDQRPDQLLSGPGGDARRRPCGGEVCGEPAEVGHGCRGVGRLQLDETRPTGLHAA